jgi:hypothetical protein
MSAKAQSFLLVTKMQDKLNTRGRLQARHMALDSYVRENCILQRLETTYHLFLRCSFATMFWTSIGITPPRVSNPHRALTRMTAIETLLCNGDSHSNILEYMEV